MTYEMLVGDPPFTGSTAQAVVAKAMTEKPIPPARLRDTIPPAVEDAVLTALQKLPADRFATAKEFADALTSDVASSRGGTRVLPAARSTSGPWRRVSALLGVATLAALALAAWALARRPAATGPVVYDAALPDSAPIAYAATASRTGYGVALRNLSVDPAGTFAVYAAREGDSSDLWYRSLRDGTVRRIEGTAGAHAPRISPDGRLVAFYSGNRVGVVPVAGGEPRMLLEVQGSMMLEWLSDRSLLAGTEDGFRMTWIDPETGPVRSQRVARCLFGRWDPVSRRLMCRGNNLAIAVDPDSGGMRNLRTTGPDGSDGPPLAGSGFRIVGGDMLMYISAEGELRVAPYDAATERVGRPATLWKGIRSEAAGDAQYDVTADGTLVFAPGVNAEIGRLVRLRPGGTPEPVVAEQAPFQRFDLSPDRRWLAAVAQTPEGQELRLYDTRDGQRAVLARGDLIRHPLWSPSGDRLLAFARTGGHAAILGFVPGSGRAPDTLVAGDTATVRYDVIDYPSEHELVTQEWGTTLTSRIDPATPSRGDTLLTEARFVSVAPGGRLMSYQNIQGTALGVTTHPVAGRRWQVASDGAEPMWLAADRLLYRLGASWFLVHVDPATGEPRGTPEPWAQDPRFSDTGGWSNRPSRDGGIIYLQGPAETSGAYLRIIPGWVAEARRAVAEVNR
jgi:serine/threonine-protein kinase